MVEMYGIEKLYTHMFGITFNIVNNLKEFAALKAVSSLLITTSISILKYRYIR